MTRLAPVVVALLGLLHTASAVFYLPGVAPKNFETDAPVQLLVNKVTSTHTQIPYDYYDLPYPRPKLEEENENLGQVLAGDHIENSEYLLKMRRNEPCKIVDAPKRLTKKEANTFRQFIKDDYRVHWIIDNIPAAMVLVDSLNPEDPFYVRGFPVGFIADDDVTGTPLYFIYNHIRIIVEYNLDDNDDGDLKEFNGARIVGFKVEPFSIKHTWDKSLSFDVATTHLDNCNGMVAAVNDPSNYQEVAEDSEVLFTYDTMFIQSETRWANRWDAYLKGNPDDKIHWFSIANSMMIVVFLTVMVAMIMVRTLNKDIAAYNDAAAAEEAREESGWKLVHADVFRPPQDQPMLFAVLVGTGMQLLGMSSATMVFALLGFLSPANRGGLVNAFILLFVFMGSIAGYHSARLYKTFRGVEWKTCTMYTAFLFPGFAFVIFFILNLELWSKDSSAAVPFGTLFAMLVLWFGVSTPLVFVGSFFGYKKDAIEYPVRTNQIPRTVPEQPWYMHTGLITAFGGILPFGAVSVELFFIMSALWLHQIYYLFGFLFLVLTILVATCAEITIVMCYFQLCNEDYHWWWRSFLSSGSCAIYTFLYSIWYFNTKLDINSSFVSVSLYFGYMTIITSSFFLITGTIGFLSCLWFNIKIYGSIKVD